MARGIFSSFSSLVDSSVQTVESGLTSVNNMAKAAEVVSSAYVEECKAQAVLDLLEIKISTEQIAEAKKIKVKLAEW